MKSKTRLFLLPMLAIAIAATAFFGYANFNTPAKASATGITIYYYDSQGWGAVDLYVWKEAGGNAWWNNGWSNVNTWSDAIFMSPVPETEHWYSFTLPDDAEKVIFRNGDHNAQSPDITVNPEKPYCCCYERYDSYEWDYFETMQLANMKVANTWYLIGKLNGTESWIDSPDTYKWDGTKEKMSNVAEWHNVALKAGDKVKAVHGNDGPAFEGDEWKNCASHDGANAFYTVDGDGNGVITYDGTYNLYLYDDSGTYKVSIEKAGVESIDFAGTMYKKTTDGDQYMLLATAFDLDDLGEGEYTIGYYVNGTMYTGDTYYSSITVGSTTWSITGGEHNVYASLDAKFTAPKMIIAEVPAVTGTTYTVQAVVLKGGVVVSTGYMKTITPFPAP